MKGFLALRLSFLARVPLNNGARAAAQQNLHRCQMTTLASAEERFDVLNADGSLAGHNKPRSEVHRDGDLHRSTHIWVLSTAGNPARLLMQLRSEEKDTFPGRWDVSAAGHITAGDQSLPSAVREVEEELGLKVGDKGSKLEFAFSARSAGTGETKRHGAFVDNEIQDVYIFRRSTEVDLDELVLQEEEVADVKFWKWPEFRAAQRAEDDRFVPRSKEYMEAMEACFDSWEATARADTRK